MWTTPSGDSLFNDHPFGTFDAWSGRRPPHQLRRFDRGSAASGLPYERTSSERACMSEKCQQAASARNQRGRQPKAALLFVPGVFQEL
jgi:hypothetical protein